MLTNETARRIICLTGKRKGVKKVKKTANAVPNEFLEIVKTLIELNDEQKMQALAMLTGLKTGLTLAQQKQSKNSIEVRE